MNDLQLATPVEPSSSVTMTTLQIAEMCDKHHKHVLDDVRKMLIQLENLTAEKPAVKNISGIFTSTYESRGKLYEMYVLDKRMTTALVAGYDLGFRLRIIDRLEYLEQERRALPAPVVQKIDVRDLSISETHYLMSTLLEHDIGQIQDFIKVETKKAVQEALGQLTYVASETVTESPDDLLTSRELGEIKGVSSRRMDKILVDLGFQIRGAKGFIPSKNFDTLYTEFSRSVTKSYDIVVDFSWKRRVLDAIPEIHFRKK